MFSTVKEAQAPINTVLDPPLPSPLPQESNHLYKPDMRFQQGAFSLLSTIPLYEIACIVFLQKIH